MKKPQRLSPKFNQRNTAQPERQRGGPLNVSIAEVGKGNYPQGLSNIGLNYDPRSSGYPRRVDMAPGMNPNAVAQPGYYPPYPNMNTTMAIGSVMQNAMVLDRENALSYISELKPNAYVVATGKTRTGEELVEVEHMFTTDQPYAAPAATHDMIILTQMSAEEFINLYLDTLDTEDTFGLSDFMGSLSFTIQQAGNRMYGALEGQTYLVDQALVDQAIEDVKDVKEEPMPGFYQRPAIARVYRLVEEHRAAKVKEQVQILSDLINQKNVKPSIDETGLATISFIGKDVSVIVQPSTINPFYNVTSYKVTWVRHNPQLAHEGEQTYTYGADSFFTDVVPKIKQLVSQ